MMKRFGKKSIPMPKRQMRRNLGNPKLPTGAQTSMAWDQRNSELADINMERLRNTGIPVDQKQFVQAGAKTFRNTKRQAYKW